VGDGWGREESTPQPGLILEPCLPSPRLGGIIPGMVIGDKLRALREEKKLSQGDIEKRTGLLPVLHLPRREWAYRTSHRDPGKTSACA
jgi:hypothetical protein